MRAYLNYTFLFICSICFAQTAILKAKKVYPNEREKNNHIKFIVNQHTFGEKDTTINLNINKTNFDNLYAIIDTDTLHFKTKFKENETYEIKQGCCCAAFTLEAQNNPKRGVVKYKNNTKQNEVLIVAQANIETVKPNETQTIYASESAMCLFKPCSILVTHEAYIADKYDYKSDDRDYETLWKEQEKFIKASTWFHFLHGEKIEILYDEKNKNIEIKLIGYLTQKEFQKAIEK
jgi:hypothetical protein